MSEVIQIVFNLLVNYSRSLKASIAVGKYDWVNEEITEINFPTDKDEQGVKKVTFQLFHFNQMIKSEEVILKMREERCRPATLRELLAFGEANPELQKRFTILALKSPWVKSSGFQFVAALYSDYGKRGLNWRWFGSLWADSCHFLAVSE